MFIGINTSDAKRGYDTDNKVSKIQIFISKLKEKKIKEKENKIKELEGVIKKLSLNQQIREYKLSKNVLPDNKK